MNYRLVLFDFDGTLADSFPFFLQVFNELAAEHGFKAIDPATLPSLRHHTARQMMKHVGMPFWKLPIVAKSFIARMRVSVSSIQRFDGVDAVLKHLVAKGATLAIVTSNSLENVHAILGPDNMRHISHFECGMSIFGKPARIQRVFRQTRIPREAAIYIGDQLTDLEAAHKAGIPFGAVSWGYGTLESMRTHGADHEFESMSELKRLAGEPLPANHADRRE
jgi:phosphoglycolate phosphatase